MSAFDPVSHDCTWCSTGGRCNFLENKEKQQGNEHPVGATFIQRRTSGHLIQLMHSLRPISFTFHKRPVTLLVLAAFNCPKDHCKPEVLCARKLSREFFPIFFWHLTFTPACINLHLSYHNCTPEHQHQSSQVAVFCFRCWRGSSTFGSTSGMF